MDTVRSWLLHAKLKEMKNQMKILFHFVGRGVVVKFAKVKLGVMSWWFVVFSTLVLATASAGQYWCGLSLSTPNSTTSDPPGSSVAARKLLTNSAVKPIVSPMPLLLHAGIRPAV